MTEELTPYRQENPAMLARAKIYAGIPDDDVQLALAICQKYGLDPLLRHVVLIKGNVKEGEKWISRYSLYITRDGLLDIAHRSGIPWAIAFSPPRKEQNPYTGQEDIYLEGTLHRTGYPDYSAGLWFSEYAQRTREGKLAGAWATHPAAMHQKVVEVFLLRRGFNVALTAFEEVEASVRGEIIAAGSADATEMPEAITPDIPPSNPEARALFNDTARTALKNGWSADQIRALLNEYNGDYARANAVLLEQLGV